MSRKVVAMVLAVAAVAATAAVARGGSGTANQRIALASVGTHGFRLVPLTAGALKQDAGTATFCCWTDQESVINGQTVGVTVGPKMTLETKQGTLVAMNRMEFRDVPGGVEIFSGTWKIVSGTGVYSGIVGGGGVAGVVYANGRTVWQRQGLVYSK
jgi:hypothetical protein